MSHDDDLQVPHRVLQGDDEVCSGTLHDCLKYGLDKYPVIMNLCMVMSYELAFKHVGLKLEPIKKS